MKTKRCCTCREEKSHTEFNKKRSTKDGLQPLCKACNRKRSRKYYRDNIEKHREVVAGNKKIYLARNQKYIWNWLASHPCVDCNETDIVVLEFDHLGNKEECLSRAVNSGWSIERIQREIDKCEVRCSNCHRRRTAKEYNWKILEYEQTREDGSRT